MVACDKLWRRHGRVEPHLYMQVRELRMLARGARLTCLELRVQCVTFHETLSNHENRHDALYSIHCGNHTFSDSRIRMRKSLPEAEIFMLLRERGAQRQGLHFKEYNSNR
jgi:hypothetical protein